MFEPSIPLGVRLLRLRHTLTSVKHQTDWMGDTSPTLAGYVDSALVELDAIIAQERGER